MVSDFSLRDVLEADLPTFFAYQLDPEAQAMAAFITKDPTDRQAFMAHWHRILADPTVIIWTIVVDGQVAGSVLSYEDAGHPEVSYWLGKNYWGKGLATRALATFLAHANLTRPTYARAAKDNIGSLRVLEKCGFRIIGEDKGYANVRGKEIEEYLLQLQ
jgi:RimJ/RimL family protein N-acetyltransferase